MHPYQAESDVELTLSLGDYVVVRKVHNLLELNFVNFSETRLYLMYPVENNYLRSANLDRLQIMVGLKGNAKEKLDGSHLDTLKEGTAFSRARWLKCSDIFPALTFLCSRFCTCMFCSRVVTNMRIPPLTAFFFFLTCRIVKSPLCAN